MKEKQASIVDLLFPENVCYQIPPFQRNYQWDIPQIHRLIHDISFATFQQPKHWLGVALVGNSSLTCELGKKVNHHCRDILDGQQRFITLRLWCTALVDEFMRQTGHLPTITFTGKPLTTLERENFTEIRVHALDSDAWETVKNSKVLNVTNLDNSDSSSIQRAYLYFRYALLVGLDALTSDEELRAPDNRNAESTLFKFWLHEIEIAPFSPDDILELIQKTLERLSVSVLEHEVEDEDIEVIFETLNAARVELGQFDLFRNYLLIKAGQDSAQNHSLYTKHLQNSEKSIHNAKLNIRKRPLDRFLYDFLISQSIFDGTLKTDATAREFKKYWDASPDAQQVKRYVEKTLEPSMDAWLIAVSAGEAKKLQPPLPKDIVRVLTRIENLSRGPFTPLTTRLIFEWMQLPEPRAMGVLLSNLRLVETFAARSLLAGVPFSPLRREIMSACKQIFKDHSITLHDWVVDKSPDDQRIRQVLTQSVARDVNGMTIEPDPKEWVSSSDFYQRAEPRQIRAILDGLVEHMNGAQTAPVVAPPAKKLTKNEQVWVEHLYPQDMSEWIEDIADWGSTVQRMANRLHALGNLTVLPMKENIQLGKKRFSAKKAGFQALPIQQFKMMNSFLVAERWTEKEIDARTIALTNVCLEVWALPERGTETT